ncbi:MAG TPA: M14 family zinc carboxypeptidase [Longimicrobiales bacterium]
MNRIASIRRSVCVPAVLVALAAPAAAQVCEQMPSGPAVGAGSSIPSPADVLGHSLGQRFTTTEEVLQYARVLDAASELVTVQEYGRSQEGRPLIQIVIATPAHRARLDDILADVGRLRDAGLSAGDARAIAARNPAVVWFSYGVHGNESSSTEAALWTAWDIVRNAPAVANVLDSLVVLIDPVANPDGRARYVNWFRQAMGAAPNPDPNAREHWEPWPGGRYNHWLFDLNRDWAFATQPETRARLASWNRWAPQVHVDFHEMSSSSSYFFFPAAPPINPIYPRHVLEWGQYLGEANASAFDRCGWAYFTGEDFDFFYPGYGDTWPSLTGAIAATYEQGGHSRAGLAVRKPDGSVLTLADRAQHHRASGSATLRAVAARKSDLLGDYARFHRESPSESRDILLLPDSAGRGHALVQALLAQGIEVRRAGRGFRANATAHDGFAARRDFPAGTWLVPARQPRGRLATTLLIPEVVLDATYSYDVTAWSLPYAFGVEAHSVNGAPDAAWSAERGAPAGMETRTVGAAEDAYAWAIRPRLDAWPALSRFLAQGGRGIVLEESFTTEGRIWPAGTIVLPRWTNDELGRRIAETGLSAFAVPIRSGMTDSGRDLGTDRSVNLSMPRIALAGGPGTYSTSFGAYWFFLDQTLGVPYDAVPFDDLESIELADYDVLILPELSGQPDSSLVAAVDAWVRQGGRLVAVASAAEAFADAFDVEVRGALEDSADTEAARLERALRGRRERDLAEWEQEVPGVVIEVQLDPAHPLAFGAGVGGDSDHMFVLHVGDLVFEPSESIESAAWFGADLRETAGMISARNLERLEQGAWLVTRRRGGGRVVLFADDPLFRHFWYAAFVPFVNAVMLDF